MRITENIKIIAKPDSTVVLGVSVDCKNDTFFKSTNPNMVIKYDGSFRIETKIKFFVRPCIRGEILMPDNTCYFCKQGKNI